MTAVYILGAVAISVVGWLYFHIVRPVLSPSKEHR